MSTTRITKTMAEKLAKKLLEKKLEAINKDKILLSEYATSIAKSTFKPEVITAFNIHKDYFKKVNNVFFYYYNTDTGSSAETDTITLKESIPSPTNNWTTRITVDKVDYKKLNLLLLKIEKLQKEYKSALSIIENTILNLRTAVQLKKHFPEAYDALPKETNGTMLPMVNLDQVRSLIK